MDLPRGSDHVRDGREIIVMHDYIGGFIGAAGGIAGHRNSNVGLLNRLGVLGTGACHGDYLAVLAELLNYIQLLLRSYTGVDIRVKLQFVAVLHGLRNALSGDCLTGKTYHAAGRRRRFRIILGKHDNTHSGTLACPYRCRDGIPHRGAECRESNESIRKSGSFVAVALIGVCACDRHYLPAVGVELLLHLLGNEKLFAVELTQRKYLLRGSLDTVQSGAGNLPHCAAHEIVGFGDPLNELISVVNLGYLLVEKRGAHHQGAFHFVRGVRLASKRSYFKHQLLAGCVYRLDGNAAS